MKKNLENRAEDYYDREYISEGDNQGLEGLTTYENYTNPILERFTGSIKDEKRREKLEKEINRLQKQYVNAIKKYGGAPGRAALLEHSYNLVPEENEIQGKDAKQVLEKRLYATPGRHYQYLNGIVGEEKNSKGIKYKIGKAGKYAIKEGWPVLAAGAGWMLANNWYKKGINAKATRKQIRQMYKPISKPWEYGSPIIGPGKLAGDIGMRIAKRKAIKDAGVGTVGKAFDNPFWEYLGPKGVLRFGADSGKYLIGKGLRTGWKLIRTPALYAIGAYAAYKVIKYLLKRRKEKKLEHEEIERLESLRNEMLAQKQMFYLPQQQMEQAA